MPQSRGLPGERGFYLSLYYLKSKDLGLRPMETQIHKVRDALAILEVAPLLQGLGYVYRGAILNIPFGVRSRLDRISRLRAADPPVGANDLIVQLTRPPLSEGGKRQIAPSKCRVETAILDALGGHLERCTRSQVFLSQALAPVNNVSEAVAAPFRSVEFFVSAGGRVKHFGFLTSLPTPPADERLSIGYLLSVPAIGDSGARLLCGWGAGGTETLWFCHLLRTRYSRYVGEALASQEARMWTVPFLVPAYAPFPMLTCDPDELIPDPAIYPVIEWA